MNTIDLYLQEFNSAFNVNLEYTPLETMENSFLYTSQEYSGIVFAKLENKESYMVVRRFSKSPTCFLGDLEKEIEYIINIKIIFPNEEKWLGVQHIPIYMDFGQEICNHSVKEKLLNPFTEINLYWNSQLNSTELNNWR